VVCMVKMVANTYHTYDTYCISKHFMDLYQASLKQNAVETNCIHKDDIDDHKHHNVYLDVNVYIDVFYFFENPDKTDSMLGGEIPRLINIFYLY